MGVIKVEVVGGDGGDGAPLSVDGSGETHISFDGCLPWALNNMSMAVDLGSLSIWKEEGQAPWALSFELGTLLRLLKLNSLDKDNELGPMLVCDNYAIE